MMNPMSDFHKRMQKMDRDHNRFGKIITTFIVFCFVAAFIMLGLMIWGGFEVITWLTA